MVNTGACVSFGIDCVKRYPLYHILGALIVGIAGSATFGILYGPLMIGYFRGIDRQLQGEEPRIDDLFSGFQDLGASLLTGLAGFWLWQLGLMLCILPGTIAAGVLAVAIVMIERGDGGEGLDPLKRAFDRCRQHAIGIGIAMLILIIVAMLGSILCGIGIVLTLPILYAGSYKLAIDVLDG